MTKKEKLRIIADYLGCPIYICQNNTESVPSSLEGIDFDYEKIISKRTNYDIEDIKLKLRKITDITIEEKIEIAHLTNIIAERCPETDFEYWGNYVYNFYIVKERAFTRGLTTNLILDDYLKSKYIMSYYRESILKELGLLSD